MRMYIVLFQSFGYIYYIRQFNITYLTTTVMHCDPNSKHRLNQETTWTFHDFVIDNRLHSSQCFCIDIRTTEWFSLRYTQQYRNKFQHDKWCTRPMYKRKRIILHNVITLFGVRWDVTDTTGNQLAGPHLQQWSQKTSAVGVDDDGHHPTEKAPAVRPYLQNVGRQTAELIGVRDGGMWKTNRETCTEVDRVWKKITISIIIDSFTRRTLHLDLYSKCKLQLLRCWQTF